MCGVIGAGSVIRSVRRQQFIPVAVLCLWISDRAISYIVNTLVKKKHHGCSLACLESYLTDRGRKRTQDELKVTLEPLGLCNSEYVVPWGSFPHACLAIGVYAEPILYHFPLRPEVDSDSLFIIFNVQLHCIRYSHSTSPDSIMALQPDTGLLHAFKDSEMRTQLAQYFRLCI